MMVVDGRLLIAFGLVGAVSIVAFAAKMTRTVDEDDEKGQVIPKASPDGKTIDIGGTTYGLRKSGTAFGSGHWVLSLPVAAPHTFSVQREEGLEHLIEHLGPMDQVATGNARYDEEFEIRSKDPQWTQAFFADAEHRRLVQALFGLDSSTVILSDGRIQACFGEEAALPEGGPALSELAAALRG